MGGGQDTVRFRKDYVYCGGGGVRVLELCMISKYTKKSKFASEIRQTDYAKEGEGGGGRQ